MTRHLPTTSSQATHNQSSSYPQVNAPFGEQQKSRFIFQGVTLSKFIHEGRPTTMKPTFVALPSLTTHSTFYECSRGIRCKPQDSPHRPLTRLGVIISYSLRLERKITLPSTFITHWNITTEFTQKKLIYSTSRNSTTFQVGILSSISLIKWM